MSEIEKRKTECKTHQSNAESAISKLDLTRKDYAELEAELKRAKESSDELAREKRDLARKVRALEADLEKEKASVEKAVADERKSVKDSLVGQLTNELEATYKFAWETLVELASAQFPGIADIPFERREVPPEYDPKGGDVGDVDVEVAGEDEAGENEPEVTSQPNANTEAERVVGTSAETPATANRDQSATVTENSSEAVPDLP